MLTLKGIPRSRGFFSVAAIVLAGLYAHGILLFTDYRLWDGWEYGLWLSDERQLPFLKRLFSEIGRPLDGVYWRPFVGLQNPHRVAKLAGVSAWIAHAVLMYDCLRRPWALGSLAALSVAMLAVTCPVFRPLGELSLWMNTAAVAAFWLSLFLFLRMAEGKSSFVQAVLRCCSIGLMFMAFNLNSLLVYFYGLLAAAFVWKCFRSTWFDASRAALAFVRHYPDFSVLPVVFWIWKVVFTPSYGAYASYNQPTLSLRVLADGYVAFATSFGVPFAVDTASRPGVIVAACAVITAVVYGFRSRIRFSDVACMDDAPRNLLAYLTAAGVLLMAASFPYICVGQVLADDAWLGRNNILTPLALSVLVVGLVIRVFSMWVPHKSWVWFFACVAICGAWGASSALGYARLQAFGVKQLAIRSRLQQAIASRSPAVIQLRDYAPLRGEIPYYPPLIWTAMAACCDRLPETLVLDTRPYVADSVITMPSGETGVKLGILELTARDVQMVIEQTTVEYAFSEIRRSGGQVVMTVQRPPDPRCEERIGIEYLKALWFGVDRGAGFVESFIDSRIVEIQPILQAGRTENSWGP